jgi:hypothetical protein
MSEKESIAEDLNRLIEILKVWMKWQAGPTETAFLKALDEI